MTVVSDEASVKRGTFFRFIFGEVGEGYICIARRAVGSNTFHEEFFKYPSDLDAILVHIGRFVGNHDMWYCPHLLTRKSRTKDAVYFTPTAWSDLDDCEPDMLLVAPSVVIESSPNRYQALWCLKGDVPPLDAESISRRIAYYHREQGADVSGWDLTQLLRVPFTYNHKYGGIGAAPMVTVVQAQQTTYEPEDFDDYPAVAELAWMERPFPDELPEFSEVVHRHQTSSTIWMPSVSAVPNQDWSKALWHLELQLFEHDLSIEEVFVICRDSGSNKYARDGRSEMYLWKDVCKAYNHWVEEQNAIRPMEAAESFDLLTEEERQWVAGNPTLVEEYIDWARGLGDAAWQYHQAGIFTILSSLLASSIQLPTSFGRVILNLWFCIMADSTITRKTTAMDIAMDMLNEIDSDAVLATDGSIEGLFSALSHRPGRSSIFLRDEFSGMIDAMAKKDYYAGMAESLTKLYDGKFQKRILKRETIEVKDPILILFTGGIKNRLLELFSYDQVLSGFLPRFIFITAEADITKLRPLGPPTVQEDKRRNELIDKLTRLQDHYTAEMKVTVDGKISSSKRIWRAEMTPEAWALYNGYEALMLNQAMQSSHRDYLMPTFDRLAKSGLKIATIIAALDMRSDKVVVTKEHMLRGFFYIEQWKTYSIEVLSNIGKTAYERIVDGIEKAIRKDPGIHRGTIMRSFNLNSRFAEDLLITMEQRGILSRTKAGKSERLWIQGEIVADEKPEDVDNRGTINIDLSKAKGKGK